MKLLMEIQNRPQEPLVIKPKYYQEMPRINSQFIYLCLVIGLNSSFLQANVLDRLNTNIKFHSLEIQNKLSNLTINDIAQDLDGFIWIATNDGLNRLDGKNIKIYRLSKSSSENFNSSSVSAVTADHSGNIWIGLKKGLGYYNRQKDRIDKFELSGESANNLASSHIVSIFEDSAHRLWVSTLSGFIFSISRDRSRVHKLSYDNILSQEKDIYVHTFEESKNGILLSSSKGILSADYKNKVVNLFEHKTYSPEDLAKNIYTLKITPKYFLLGTSTGFIAYNANNNSKLTFFEEQLKLKRVAFIEAINEHSFILGTKNSGIYYLDFNKKIVSNFSASSSASLIDNQINTIFSSSEKQIWIGTPLGIQLINLSQTSFKHYKSNQQVPSCLKGNTIYSITKDSFDNLWIGSFGSGLSVIDLNSGSCTFSLNVPSTAQKDDLKNIVALHEDQHSNVWIGTYSNGVYIFIKKEDRFIYLSDFLEPSYDITPQDISDFAEKNGDIWISTEGQGVYKVDIKKRTMEQFTISKNNSANFIQSIDIDENTLWLATSYNGLWSLNLKTKIFSHIEHDKFGKITIPNSLTHILIDENKNLWLGTRGNGAIKLKRDFSDVKYYTTLNGLFSNVVYNIVEDYKSSIWFFTDKGLSRLNTLNNKTKTFFKVDGLQDDAFTGTGIFDKKTNQVYTGGINGFNVFNPTEIDNSPPPKKVLITDFQLFYKPVNIDSENIGTPLRENISYTKNLNLNHDQNVFSFSFAAPEFLYQERVKYAFKLDGYDQDWNYVDSDRRFANYTNIDPGNYIFKAKASNIDGEWSGGITSIKIGIAYPWWQTKVAYLSYVVSAVLLIFFIIKLRTRNLVKRAQDLEYSVNERTSELAKEKSKVEQLLSRKNEEFANVSHEFRTPLTLILGPLAQVIKKTNTEEEINRLNIVQRNGYRLLRMVDQLLNLETFRVKSITQKSPQAIGKITKLLADAFSDLAQEKEIELLIEKQIDINFEFTPDAYEKVLLNLLSNAVKYSKSGDLIRVSTERTQENKFRLVVADTGIGIPEEKLESVFERYSRVLDENSEQVTGAGIGLALVKELVETHEGKIEIESQLGVGTTISVILPIVGEVDSVVLDSHANDEIIAMELMSLAVQDSIEEVGQQTQITDNSSKPSVLVIEDNPDMRQYITASISDDYQLLTANNGEAGLKLAIDEVPDLIISDIMMPKMDGYQTANAIRNNEITSHIPIILLTARGDRESRLKGWYERADEYLTKPFDVEELKIRLQNLLEIRDILKKRFAETAFERASTIEIEDKQDVESNKNIQQQEFINQLNTHLEDIYTNSELTIPQVARAIAMSDRQLFRKLKSIVDMSPVEYLRRYRLEKSKQLLLEGKSAGYAAFEVGFSSQSYFGRCFKAQFGMSPKEFKNQVAQQQGG